MTNLEVKIVDYDNKLFLIPFNAVRTWPKMSNVPESNP